MVVIFWRTTARGSEEAARVELKAGKLEGPEGYVKLLMGGGTDPVKAMREAPQRFDGAYLRAEFRP